MINELDILKILKEDILRILIERKKKVALEIIKSECRVPHSFIVTAIESLKEENLIAVENKLIILKKKGWNKAKNIANKHRLIENYFEEKRSKREAHIAAHILEHYVSGQVINNIKKLATLKMEGVPLTKFMFNKKGVITDIMFSDHKLFERIVSMGIFLGEKIIITNKLPHGIVAKIKNKKFALDKNIAKEIKAVEYEKS
jgi:Mn-dependent DtxR family transcriptional regulator